MQYANAPFHTAWKVVWAPRQQVPGSVCVAKSMQFTTVFGVISFGLA